MRIKLNMINDINIFVSVCSKYYEGDILVKQNKQVVSAKSLLGMYSLDLTKPIDVEIYSNDEDVKRDFYNYIAKWEVEEIGV